ncbi:MAG: hypothetical protein H7X86_14130, partial [Gorillibacterium sp.]|nr:hypothetical protein [Gorillibacterium sp.]
VDFTEGKVIQQCAPAVISANMPLPIVKSVGEPPFVLAGRHPNGSISVATLPRVSNEQGKFFPRARVEISVEDARMPIAVFGQYAELLLRTNSPLGSDTRVWAQDLREDVAVDITQRVQMNADGLLLSGVLIDELCGCAATANDNPGLVIVVERS